MNYDEAVNYIINIPRFKLGKDNRCKSGIDNLKEVLNALGNPELCIPCIHIAGTNGKGSTAQYTKCLLSELGYRVGVFTSPHLVKINERISISDTGDISNQDFLECFDIVNAQVEEHEKKGGAPLSFFEMMFAIATVYFRKMKPDYVIYETGLGGRLDSTNVIKPEICAITSIGLDHVQFLGDTIEKIASEKAGIIKPGVPIIYNTGEALADEIILNTANDMCCKEINVGKTDYIINEKSVKGIAFSLHNRYYSYSNMKLPYVLPAYQADNAMTAVCICSELLKCNISHEIVEKAMNNFYWPGRMEWLAENVIVDGAHNDDAIKRFIECVKQITEDKSIMLLFAVSGDKDYKHMIKQLCDELILDEVGVTTLNSDRTADKEELLELFKEYGVKTTDDEKKELLVTSYSNIQDAFKICYQNAHKKEKKLFCVGSLYLVGSIKELASEVIND